MASFVRSRKIYLTWMKHLLPVLLVLQIFAGVALAATTLVPGTEYSFSGASFNYSKVRFVSATGESGASVSLNGDALSMGFSGFSAGTLSSPSFTSDYGRVHFGLQIQANSSNSIDQLSISAGGTYNVSANVANSWAAILGSIPFSMQVLGVNGSPYSGADLSRSYSLNLSPSSVTIQNSLGAVDQNGTPIDSSGIWTAEWSLAGIAATLAGAFQLAPGLNVTELTLAITPHFSTASVNGTSTVITDQITVTPTPEPGSLSLVGIAGLAFLAARRRRRS